MRALTAILMIGTTLTLGAVPIARADQSKPTIVLVHGAFAGSSSWNEVITLLERDGYSVVAAANPLRGVASDASSISALVNFIEDDVVLVGHSYGGPVITEAANAAKRVKALVYVSAFAPEIGESSATLSAKFPGSTLGDALTTVPRSDGTNDLYIQPEKFHQQFAADVPATQARLMAATQRPIADQALAEPSGTPAWKTIPSYSIYGSADKNIPPAVMAFMADRAASLKTVVVEGGSHSLMISNPSAVASLIEDAAAPK